MLSPSLMCCFQSMSLSSLGKQHLLRTSDRTEVVLQQKYFRCWLQQTSSRRKQNAFIMSLMMLLKCPTTDTKNIMCLTSLIIWSWNEHNRAQTCRLETYQTTFSTPHVQLAAKRTTFPGSNCQLESRRLASSEYRQLCRACTPSCG